MSESVNVILLVGPSSNTCPDHRIHLTTIIQILHTASNRHVEIDLRGHGHLNYPVARGNRLGFLSPTLRGTETSQKSAQQTRGKTENLLLHSMGGR